MKDIVVIPTYNEKENISNIINRVVDLYPNMEIWVVDDSSPDGTGLIIESISKNNSKIRLITKEKKTGLGGAYKFIHSRIQKDNSIRYVVTMDADGSHNPESIKSFMDHLLGYDLIIGSRYVKNGRIVGWGLIRFFLSYFGNIYNRIITGIPIRDCTAGFVAFRKRIIENLDFSKISSAGYAYQIEFKNAIINQGGKFKEVPITFIDRQIGKSKISSKIVGEGLIMPWRILFRDKKKFFSRLYSLFFIILISIGLFFSIFKLLESPSVWYDEGIYYQMSENLVKHGVIGIIVTPDIVEHFSKMTVGYPLIYPIATSLAIFGNNILFARIMMVIFILFVLVTSYLLIKKTVGKSEAIFSLALLISFAPLYGNGKSVLGEVPGILYLLLSLLFIYLARNKINQKISTYYLALSGLFTGLCLTTKPIFIVLIGALLFAFLLKRNDIFCFGRRIFLFLLFFAISFIIWLFTQFQSGDSMLQILSFYMNPQNVSGLFSTVMTNIVLFFTQLGPLYLLIMLIIWLMSIIIRRKKHDNIGFEEIVSFIFSILISLAFLRTSGYLRYLFPAQILSILYFPSSLHFCFKFMQEKMNLYLIIQKIFSRRVVATLIVVLSIFGFYQIMFNSWVADSYSSHKTSFWINYFSTLSSDKKVFFYDTPEVAMFMKNGNYYQYLDLSPAGFYVGKDNDFLIEKGGVDQVILKTNIFQENRDIWEKNYRLEKEVFKYTILVKKT